MSSCTVIALEETCKLHVPFSTGQLKVCHAAQPLLCVPRNPTEHERAVQQIRAANRSYMQGRSELNENPHRKGISRPSASRGLPSARQADVLAAIAAFFAEKEYAPSVRELGEMLQIRSTNGVTDLLRGLRKKGLVEWEPNKARSLRLRSPS